MGEVKGRGHTNSSASIPRISFFHVNWPKHPYDMVDNMFYGK